MPTLELLGTYLLLAVSAFAAGVVNSLAGGGTLLTFPPLTRVIDDVLANGTSTFALMPGSAAGAYAFRRELKEVQGWLKVLLWPSLIGGAIGTLLVTRLPESYFKASVPWLILGASLLFLAQPVLVRGLKLKDRPEGPPPWLVSVVTFFQLLVGIYGGYFGAGIGILMLSSLGLMGIGDIVRMNALKTVLAAAMNLVSCVIFIIEGKVVWSYGLVMMGAAIAGGYSGASLGRVLNKTFLRWFVIVVGLGLAVYYFVR
jgi:uncharacterized membrane protein YfcA